MKILITGAAGGIGSRLAARLEVGGHTVTRSSRSVPAASGWIRIDLADLPESGTLVATLRGFDVLINCAGVWPGTKDSTQQAVHRDGPIALFRAAITAGVNRIVNVSALGDTGADVFLASKHAADAWLLSNDPNALVVRPSAVFLPDGASSRLFRFLAFLPVRCVPASGPLRPVHVDDLCVLLAGLLVTPERSGLLGIVGPEELDLAGYVTALRLGGGYGRGIQWRLPLRWMRCLDPLLYRISGGLWARHGTALLAGGSTLRCDRAGLVGVTRPAEFLRGSVSFRDELARVVARLALASVCLTSAAMPLCWPEQIRPYEELSRIGLDGVAATVAFVAMLVLDVVCAFLALAGRRAWVWRFLAVVFAAYALVLGVLRPELWFDPFGGLIKNVPMVALAVVLSLTGASVRSEERS